MPDVLLACAPVEVLDAVVSLDAIAVMGIQGLGFGMGYEGLCDEPMDGVNDCPLVPPQPDGAVAVPEVLL